jgi:hypothetical protein
MIEQELLRRFDRLRVCYEELYEALKEERKYLPRAKVDELQVVVQQIEQNIATINKERTDMLAFLTRYTGNKSPSLDLENLLRYISPMYHYEFQTAYDDVTRLIDEIKRYGKENRFLIEDGLNFIEETLHTVMGAQEKNITYDEEMKLRKIKHNNLLFSKEV